MCRHPSWCNVPVDKMSRVQKIYHSKDAKLRDISRDFIALLRVFVCRDICMMADCS
jgi:hypothetical protein